MKRFVYIYSAFFLVFFFLGTVVGTVQERKLKETSNLLKVAAYRFYPGDKLHDEYGAALENRKVYYSCGDKILYSFDWKTNTKAETNLDIEPQDFEEGISDKTLITAATGLRLTGPSALVLSPAGKSSWKDLVASAFGSLSGYSVGHRVASGVLPACDGNEMMEVLRQTSVNDLARAIVNARIDRYDLLIGNQDLPLTTRLSTLKNAFVLSVPRGHENNAVPSDHGMPIEDFGTASRCDFDLLITLVNRLRKKNVPVDEADFLQSEELPKRVAWWANFHHKYVEEAFGKMHFYGAAPRLEVARWREQAVNDEVQKIKMHFEISLRKCCGWTLVSSRYRTGWRSDTALTIIAGTPRDLMNRSTTPATRAQVRPNSPDQIPG